VVIVMIVGVVQVGATRGCWEVESNGVGGAASWQQQQQEEGEETNEVSLSHSRRYEPMSR